jgi:hypothetical protein
VSIHHAKVSRSRGAIHVRRKHSSPSIYPRTTHVLFPAIWHRSPANGCKCEALLLFVRSTVELSPTRWKAKFGRMDVSEARKLKTLKTVNSRLKMLLSSTGKVATVQAMAVSEAVDDAEDKRNFGRPTGCQSALKPRPGLPRPPPPRRLSVRSWGGRKKQDGHAALAQSYRGRFSPRRTPVTTWTIFMFRPCSL